MKILKIIKGFVTNSSSANYWLNDEVLEKWEKASSTIQDSQEEVNNTQIQEANTQKSSQTMILDFGIWILFSIIVVLIAIHNKFKK